MFSGCARMSRQPCFLVLWGSAVDYLFGPWKSHPVDRHTKAARNVTSSTSLSHQARYQGSIFIRTSRTLWHIRQLAVIGSILTAKFQCRWWSCPPPSAQLRTISELCIAPNGSDCSEDQGCVRLGGGRLPPQPLVSCAEPISQDFIIQCWRTVIPSLPTQKKCATGWNAI
jgi:hypothetical protein